MEDNRSLRQKQMPQNRSTGTRRGGNKHMNKNANFQQRRDDKRFIKDEDILIEFMGHLRKGQVEAVEIHSKFGNDMTLFVQKAREYLKDSKCNKGPSQTTATSVSTSCSTVEVAETVTSKTAANDPTLEQPFTDNLTLESYQTLQEHRQIPIQIDTTSINMIHEVAQKGEDAQELLTESTICDRPFNNPNTNPPPSENTPDHNPSNINTITSPSPTATLETTAASETIPVGTKVPSKRLFSRHTDQPGRVQALSTHRSHSSISTSTTMNDMDRSSSYSSNDILIVPPKAGIYASWQLPLEYIRKRALEIATIQYKVGNTPDNHDIRSMTIQDALTSLTIGLFRRGCAENGAQNAIIAKQIVSSSGHGKTDTTTTKNSLSDALQALQFHEQQQYQKPPKDPKDIINITTATSTNHESFPYSINHQLGIIHGTVPFFAPRTPGNVVLRLYFEHDPLYTLATSQCITVCITPDTLEPTLRFLLSNFKNQKGSGINFSSMHSLSSVLEQFKTLANNSRIDPAAGPKAWGAICESKKIVDAARRDYLNKCMLLEVQEKELQLEKETEENNTAVVAESSNITSEENDEVQKDKDMEDQEHQESSDHPPQKMKLWQHHMEKASNDRKWREVQLAYASILQSVVSNKVNMHKVLKPDLIKNIHLEYELWCPWCESFAPNPFHQIRGDDDIDSFLQLKTPYYSITDQDFEACRRSKIDLQKQTFGFAIIQEPIDNIAKGIMTPLLHSLSSAIADQFTRDFLSPDSNDIMQKKLQAQAMAQKAVDSCHLLEPGTKVVVFGSSANGFGSPHSDLDMCLQLPNGVQMTDEDSVRAMTVLAEKLTELGMVDVDTGRLTARVPVIKFCAKVDDTLIECDISKANILACMNTHLLRCYAKMSPVVRALAAVIKRWAKSRNMNDPSRRTLSSYGYILLLLHFLTTHSMNQDGNYVSMLDDDEWGTSSKSISTTSRHPLVPNLQWVNVHWATMNHHAPALHSHPYSPESAPPPPYTEMIQKPRTIMPHPTEPSYMVNSHFLNLDDESTVQRNLQSFTEHNLPPSSLGKLLASFFYYYAYQFDYKKHVVSLNATVRNGHVYRENKAEYDGWKVFGSSLSIEDPFEEFYDVAHVLTPMNFLRMKREFARAYAKIVEMAQFKERQVLLQKKQNSKDVITKEDGVTLLDLICEKLEQED